MNTSQTACVTGATGCVGRNLVDALISDGWQVTVLHRRSSDLSRLAGCLVRCEAVDLHDLVSVQRAIPADTDAVFHCAGNTSHWRRDRHEQWLDNVVATRNIVDACLRRGVGRLAVTSTAAVLRWLGYTDDSVDLIPIPYVRTKRQAELEVLDGVSRGLDAVIVRPLIVLGKYDWNSYCNLIRYIASCRRVTPLVFPGSIEFCGAQAVARGHLLAWEYGTPGAAYVLGGPRHTWLEFSQRVADLAGSYRPQGATPRLALEALALGMQIASLFTGRPPTITRDLLALCCDDPPVPESEHSKALRMGYRSCELDEMLAECWEWMFGNGQ